VGAKARSPRRRSRGAPGPRRTARSSGRERPTGDASPGDAAVVGREQGLAHDVELAQENEARAAIHEADRVDRMRFRVAEGDLLPGPATVGGSEGAVRGAEKACRGRHDAGRLDDAT